jgi:DNA-binding CsgD family transcriptional regulator
MVTPPALTGRLAAAQPVLTARQRAILEARVSGKTFKQIAGELGRSIKTIEFHWSVIQARSGLRDIALITQWALRNGLARWTVVISLLLAGCTTRQPAQPIGPEPEPTAALAMPPRPPAVAAAVEAPEPGAMAAQAPQPPPPRDISFTYAAGFAYYDIETATNLVGPWTAILSNCVPPAAGDLVVTNHGEPQRYYRTVGHNDPR